MFVLRGPALFSFGFFICLSFSVICSNATPPLRCYLSDAGSDVENSCADVNNPCHSLPYVVTAGCSEIILLDSIFVNQSSIVPDNVATFSLAGTGNRSSITCENGGGVFPLLKLTTTAHSTIASFALYNLTIQGCHTPASGGVIQVEHTSPHPIAIRLAGCRFTGCLGQCNGGPVSVEATSTGTVDLSLGDCHFNNNTVRPCSPAPGDTLPPSAGVGFRAPFLAGHTISITRCTFDNQIGVGASAIFIRAADRVDLTGVTFTGNIFSPYQSPLGTSVGGTVVVLFSRDVTLDSCIWDRNANDASHLGGDYAASGILVREPGPGLAPFRMSNCLFTNNEHMAVTSTQLGAIVWVETSGMSTLVDSSWSRNTVSGPGPMLMLNSMNLTMVRCSMTQNEATHTFQSVLGGLVAITDLSGTHLEDCRFIMNTIRAGDAYGALLFISDMTANVARVFLSRSQFLANLATCENSAHGMVLLNGYTGELHDCTFVGNQLEAKEVAWGGALHAIFQQAVSFTDMTFRENLAQAAQIAVGGALSVQTNDLLLTRCKFTENHCRADMSGTGGAAAFMAFRTPSTLVVNDTLLVDNGIEADTASGGSLYLGGFASSRLDNTTFSGARQLALSHATSGGCLYISGRSKTDLSECTFAECEAQRGGAVLASDLAAVTVLGSHFVGCLAWGDGGAVATRGPLVMMGSECTLCSASTGGCLWAMNTAVTISNATFTSNTARIGGGAFFLENCAFSLTESLVADSTVEQGDGGALWARGGTVFLSGTFGKNRADHGGVISASGTQFISNASNYYGNEANSGTVWHLREGSFLSVFDRQLGSPANQDVLHGAGYFTNVTNVTLAHSELSQNTAAQGGALAAESCHLTLRNLQLDLNGGQGGVLWASGSTIDMSNCCAQQNRAEQGHGAVFFLTSASTLAAHHSTFYGNTASKGRGGVLRAERTATWAFDGCIFQENEAYLDGGAISSDLYTDHSCTDCQFLSNSAGDAGAAIALVPTSSAGSISLTGCLFAGHGQGPFDTLPNGTLAFILSPALKRQDIGRGFVTNCTFTQNSGGALFLMRGARVRVDATSVFRENTPNFFSTRPLNAFVGGESTLTLDEMDVSGLNDTAIAGGSLWIYCDQHSIVNRPFGAPPLLPALHAAISQGEAYLQHVSFAKPAPLEITLLLDDSRSLAGFLPACYFAPREGITANQSAPFYRSREGPWLGTCALPLPPDENADRYAWDVWMSNDGMEVTFIGTVTVYHSWWTEFVPALVGIGCLVALTLVVLLIYILVRWVRLKRATTIELASWRSYQVASVDFTHLKILERIGHGAAGEVFKGDLNGTTVAIKRLFDTSQTEERLADFKREVAMMRTLRHPYIVALIGATFENPKLIITEFMGRGSLYALLHDEAANLPMELRLRMAFDMARGLNYLHTLRPPILHRDIKSQNMLVTDDLRVKVSDFGISRLSQEAGITTAAGTPGLDVMLRQQRTLARINPNMDMDVMSQHGPFAGMNPAGTSCGRASEFYAPVDSTPGVMVAVFAAWSAPEVLRGDRSWLPSDVYSFGVCFTPLGMTGHWGYVTDRHHHPDAGVVLWELMTRQTPWADVPPLRVMMTVAQGARLPIPADCPPVLGELMQRCFLEDPEARPTMQQIVDVLSPEVLSHPYVDGLERKKVSKKRRTGGAISPKGSSSELLPQGGAPDSRPLLGDETGEV
ncbi:putative protein kinase [Paratrimastix pyriformis]|uniref:Protein kinase domain-containing protein n=1 Tax=Paratrimastix pyriformis TaxID=342808 RepID=A0ABQ8UAN9_9EUKA|nr:putative protein kinase [Paratrimastix pyriformis]